MEVLCPICASRAALGDPQAAVLCTRCGRRLTAADAAPPGDAAAEDEALVAELRDAFDSGAYTLEVKAVRRTAASGHSSDAFAGVLKTGPLPAGTRLADFEIIDMLGRGGMGVVYRARQVSLDRQVALKVLPVSGRHAAAESTAVTRFRTEAQAAARLHHTNIVPVYAQGECDHGYYYAMELIEGTSLDRMIRQRSQLLTWAPERSTSGSEPDPVARTLTEWSGPPAPSDEKIETEPQAPPLRRTLTDYRHLAGLVAEVADGLEHAHQSGVIHRDVKPHNLLLGRDNRLHIADFGLARLTDQPHLTMAGDVMGTPSYLSPEQVRANGHEVDHRTDIYSLGVTLYELITWRHPSAARRANRSSAASARSSPSHPGDWRATSPSIWRPSACGPSRRKPIAAISRPRPWPRTCVASPMAGRSSADASGRSARRSSGPGVTRRPRRPSWPPQPPCCWSSGWGSASPPAAASRPTGSSRTPTEDWSTWTTANPGG